VKISDGLYTQSIEEISFCLLFWGGVERIKQQAFEHLFSFCVLQKYLQYTKQYKFQNDNFQRVFDA
jgi:hypothetical protein